MDKPAGLRERKKLRNRAALVAAAIELFTRQGYDKTTVAQIAEAAELSTRTFFLHFAAKEDVLLANADHRLTIGEHVIASRTPDQSIDDVLLSAMAAMITDTDATDIPSGLAAIRAELIATNPAVQARLFQQLFTGQSGLIQALHQAFGDDLDVIEAAARVGGIIGAVNAAMLVSLRRGDSPDAQRRAMLRAAKLITGGD